VQSRRIFRGWESHYELSELGFSWCAKLRRFCPEDKNIEPFFKHFIETFHQLEKSNKFLLDVFFQMKCYQFLGVCPRFDQYQSTVFFQPSDFSMWAQSTPGALRLENLTRQILEFIRRHDLSTVLEKESQFPEENLRQAKNLLAEVEKYHGS
jgi:recombinational DNA repair protein (RecF pathway)